jgi:hypothetical protein
MHWTEHWLGLDSASGDPYLFWSGIGSDLAYLGIFWALLRRYNCHQPRCPRLGRFPVEGTQWKACRHHHPAPPQRDDIRKRYHLYAGERPGRG